METYHSVIHSDTGKTITAFILENDATWVGREKEIFYATPLYCEKDQKIKMIFVKTYRFPYCSGMIKGFDKWVF